MVETKYDKVTSVDIGRTAGDHVTITNVLYFTERIVSVESDMVTPLTVINDWNPSGVHQSHKYLELELALDTDWLTDAADRTTRWAYTQNVDAGDSAPAIDEDGSNTAIEYFQVNVREHDGTPLGLVYANVDTNVLWCTGETTEISNEDNTPHQTVVFRFICLQDVS